MDKLQKTRLDWIKVISRSKRRRDCMSQMWHFSTYLRKWLKRYAEEGITGLKELSRKPQEKVLS